MPVKKMIAAAVCTMMIFLVPLGFYIGERNKNTENKEINDTAEIDSSREIKEDGAIILVLKDEGTAEMTLHDYLIGVVAAEMSASYHEEALKAQAIAARTYTYYKINVRTNHPESAGHENADVCTDYSHCQSYADEESLREKWGTEYEKYLTKVTEAVEATDGEVITYQRKVISALFHAISSGKTESAEDVWGNDYPYLQSVDSHWDLESKGYQSMVSMSADDWMQTVREAYPEAQMCEKTEEIVGEIVRSEAGGIKTAEIMEMTLTGKQIRNLFGLRSTNITFSVEGDQMVMTVLGYGHGVGMSQDGAKGMAEEGKTAEEIVRHYYTDCEVVNYSSL